MGIETQVWSPDGTSMLAILDGASSVRWTDLLGDVGSGSCTLSIYDPKYSLGNVQKGNLIKFVLNGSPAFAFFNTAPKLVVGEAETSVLTLAGDSVLAYLGRAAAYPPSWAGSGTYLTGYTLTGKTPGYILKTLIDAAQLRGTGLKTISALTYDFTAILDSAGAAWTANADLTIDAKATLLDVAKKLVAEGIGIYMDPQLKLHAYVPGTQGANLTASVIWQLGKHFLEPIDNTGSMPTTVALVQGAGGKFIEVSDPAYTENPAYGRIETTLDYSTVTGDTTQMTNAGQAQISLSETAGQAIKVKLTHGPNAATPGVPGSGGLFEPYSDYHPGDTVALYAAGSYANTPAQIVGLQVTQLPNNDYFPTAYLGSIALPIELRLARMLAATTGTTSNVSGGVSGNLTLCNPRGFPSGSAFPLNPTALMLWWRTDLGGECYQRDSTNTYWLSTTLYYGNYFKARQVDAIPLTANGTWDGPFPHPTQSIWMENLFGWFYVQTTNDGTNYWVFTDSATGTAVSTISKAPNTWLSLVAGVAQVVVPTPMSVSSARSNTPGGLVWTLGYTYRRIAT